MSKQFKADMSLLLMVVGWGASYYMLDEILNEATPMAINGVRFLGAFLIALPFTFKRLKNISKAIWKYSILVGIALFTCYAGVTYGIKYTSLSNSAFLCALPVIFVPILQFLFLKKSLEKRVLIAVVLCFIGIALMTLQEGFSVNPIHLKGDMLCIIAAISYAVDLLITEKGVNEEKVDALQMGVLQLGVTGALMILGTLSLENTSLPQSPRLWLFLFFLTVVCTGIPFIIQPIAQQYTTAAHVGIIFTLEPVFASIVAFFIGGEILSPKAYFGAILMLLALLLTEINPASLMRKK